MKNAEYRCINSNSILWLKGFHSASYITKYISMPERKKKTDTVSLKLPTLQCIKMFNSNGSRSCIYEKSSSKMYVSKNCLQKRVSPWGVSWERVLRSKKCVQICKANNWSWGIQKRGCADERKWNWTFFYGNFSLCHARYGFFCFFQTSVKGITLNGELSTFYLFLFHLLLFLLLV